MINNVTQTIEIPIPPQGPFTPPHAHASDSCCYFWPPSPLPEPMGPKTLTTRLDAPISKSRPESGSESDPCHSKSQSILKRKPPRNIYG